MGNCHSNNNQQRNTDDGRGAVRGAGRSGDRRRVIQSMVRVGSRVFRQDTLERDVAAADVADAAGAAPRGTLMPHKASTYEHVHEIVERGIDGRADAAAAGRVGLANLGNTCFLASSLQCLSNTIPLTDYFLGYDYRGEINRENALGTKGELVASYAELTKNLWLGAARAYAPIEFKADLGRFAPQFQGCEQHDAQELLAFLLDGIHEDLNRVLRKPYIEDEDCDGTNDEGDAIAAWSHYLQRDRSIIVDLFQGQLRNTMTCRNAGPGGTAGCGHVNVKFDAFMYLSLPVADGCDSVDDCLDLFCEEELLSGDEQWYCPKCKMHVDATKKIDLFMLPPILIIHLKRFKFSKCGQKSKIDRSISYLLNDWTLSHAKKSRGGIYPLYDLYAVSHHQGGVSSGHYTAHAKNRFDGEWYSFDDARCRRADPGADRLGHGASAYCLFYNRAERRPCAGGPAQKTTVIRRQSLARPELWPHLQRGRVTEWKAVPDAGYARERGEGGDEKEEKEEELVTELARISE